MSRRETKIRVDGYMDRARAVRTGCPQGSPIPGMLANYYSALLLKLFSQENTRNQDKPTPTMEYRQNNITPITAGLFINDGSLYTASDSPTTNARRLKTAFEIVIAWAGQNRLKIDMNKVNYICFIHPHKRKIPPILPITLPTSTNPGETRTYEPLSQISGGGL